MTTTKLKNQKPIEVDASFKYKCPSESCGNEHWLFLRQAKVKNFKIVCECGTIFKPKQIKNIEVVYSIKESLEKRVDEPVFSDTIDEPPEYVSRAINIMVSLGYSKKDAQIHIIQVYKKDKIEDPGLLVKKAVSQIGGI